MFSFFNSHKKYFYILVAAFLLVPAAYAQNAASGKDFKDSFKRFDLVTIASNDALQQVNRDGRIRITTSGRNYELALEQNDLRSRLYRAEDVGYYGTQGLPRTPVTTYKGRIEHEPGSEVRLTINEEKIEGYFISRGETFLVEPASRYSTKAPLNQLVVYRKQDFLGDDGFSCPSDLEEKIEGGKRFIGESNPQNLTNPGVIELATEADFEYVGAAGSAALANTEIMDILNMAEGMFASELNLSIQVTYQHTWSSPDPFVGTNATTLISSFQGHWNSDPALMGVHRDAAHLFSGKSAVLSMGYAYIGTICRSPGSAYGFSGRVTWAPAKYLVTAHELGHNLDAAHAEVAQGCGNTLMNAQLSGNTTFSFCPFSQQQINAFNSTHGSCLAPPASPSTAAFDFDGDSKTDTSIFRPNGGQWWYTRSSDGSPRVFLFGNASDVMVPADFTGDGATDIAFWRPETGQWYVLRSEDSSFYSVPFGANGDIPVPADYDGDGKSDIAVFRPSTRTWFISNSAGGTTIQQFGAFGDLPVVSDYDGDGKTDIAIFRPGVSEWWINKSGGGVSAFQFGAPGDKTVPADYTGDGKADVALWRPSSGAWFILRSEDSSYYSAMFGASGDIPVPGDYDGDGIADNAVWRPANNTWYQLRSQAGFNAVTFGSAGDRPVPSSFVP